jgi:hypothetical protein
VSCSLDPNSITTAKSSAGLQQSSRSPPWCRLFWRQPPLTFCANHLEPSGSILMSALPPKADMCGATRDVRYGPIADIGERNSLLDLRLLLSQFWLGFKIGSGFVLRCAGTAFEP